MGTTRTTTRDTDKKKKTNAQAEADEFVEVADVDMSDGLVALDALDALEAVEPVDPLLELIFCNFLKVSRTAVQGGCLRGGGDKEGWKGRATVLLFLRFFLFVFVFCSFLSE